MQILERWFGIEGKVAAIVGATPIGVATEKLFNEVRARATLVPVISDAGDSEKLDPADEKGVAAQLDKIVAEHGKLDILVYTATQLGAYPFTEMTLAQWDRIQGIHLRGAFVTMREAVRRMIPTGGGRIVALSTIGTLHPVMYGNAAYGSSKAGLNVLVRDIAFDHMKDGILANVVIHGNYPVGGVRPADMPPLSGPALQPGRGPLGRGDPEELAAAILYLVSPAGSATTGQRLMVDRGFLLT